jgi:hypothetical protein
MDEMFSFKASATGVGDASKLDAQKSICSKDVWMYWVQLENVHATS